MMLAKASLRYAFADPICAEALLRKSEPMGLSLLLNPSARKTEHKAVGDCWVFLKIVRLFLSVQKETDERKISDTSRVSLRSMPLFAADAAWVEMVNAGEL